MEKSDLKQIKQIVDTSVKQIVDTSVKQIVDTSIKENNKKIFERIEDKIDSAEDRIMTSTQKEFNVLGKRFNKVDKRFDGIDKSLNKINTKLKDKTSKNDLEDWKFDQGFKKDIDSLKYVNIDKLKNLPHRNVIVKTLVKNGLK